MNRDKFAFTRSDLHPTKYYFRDFVSSLTFSPFHSRLPQEDDSFTRPKEKTACALVRGPRASVRETTATWLVNPWTMKDWSFSRSTWVPFAAPFHVRYLIGRVRGGVDLRRAITRRFHSDAIRGRRFDARSDPSVILRQNHFSFWSIQLAQHTIS